MTARSRVMVIDDDASVRDSLRNLLESEGHDVDTFESADAFLARQPHPGATCLVLDIELPGMDGLALQRKLAGSAPIVFITGHGDLPMGIRAMKDGAVDFLSKPFSDDDLLGAVAQALARSADRCRAAEEGAAVQARIATLTPREYEVFRLVIAGLLNKQISDELGAALRTVKTHRSRVMQKLGVVSVADLVRLSQVAGVSPASHHF